MATRLVNSDGKELYAENQIQESAMRNQGFEIVEYDVEIPKPVVETEAEPVVEQSPKKVNRLKSLFSKKGK